MGIGFAHLKVATLGKTRKKHGTNDMTNNLRFRAWHKELKEMFHVRAINFFDDGTIYTIGCLETPGTNNVFYAFPKEVELMQFTGLKDIHKKLIFEGDIVTYKLKSILRTEHIEEIRWDAYSASFKGFYMEPWGESYDFLQAHLPYEVIGNIYEHSDLVEQK